MYLVQGDSKLLKILILSKNKTNFILDIVQYTLFFQLEIKYLSVEVFKNFIFVTWYLLIIVDDEFIFTL